MSEPINPFNDELISAYIDGALSADEQPRVAALLQRDSSAAGALAELQYTRRVLAAVPPMAVPRAFTLTEAMVGQTKRQPAGWLAWFKPAYLRGAAALVAVCLLIVLVGDVGTRSHLFPTAQPMVTHVEQGGLTPDQGDPTGVVAKAPTTDPDAAASSFLGLQPQVLLALEVSLALLLMVLLVSGWQLSRVGSSG